MSRRQTNLLMWPLEWWFTWLHYIYTYYIWRHLSFIFHSSRLLWNYKHKWFISIKTVCRFCLDKILIVNKILEMCLNNDKFNKGWVFFAVILRTFLINQSFCWTFPWECLSSVNSILFYLYESTNTIM
jgi:hypothetical protein